MRKRSPPPRKRNGHDRKSSHDPMLTVAELAERLVCSEVTVRRRVRDGSLPALKHGRIIRVRESDLVAFLRSSHATQ